MRSYDPLWTLVFFLENLQLSFIFHLKICNRTFSKLIKLSAIVFIVL